MKTTRAARPKRKRRLGFAAGTVVVTGGLGLALLLFRNAPPPERTGRPVLDLPEPSATAYKGPTFTRFETPSNVRVNVIGAGFEVFNTDPAQTGKEIEVTGITDEGVRIKYKVKLPPPVPNHGAAMPPPQ